MTNHSDRLGDYDDASQLDHDVEMLLGQVLSDISARGVEWAAALASVRRVARRMN